MFYSATIDILTSGPTLATLNWAGVDEVTFQASNWNLVLDHLTVTTAGSVPEPMTWAMMAIGFGAVGAASRARARPRALVR